MSKDYKNFTQYLHLVNQEKFHKFFKKWLTENNLTQTYFMDPPGGDLKNMHLNNYLSKFKKNTATNTEVENLIEHILSRHEYISKNPKNGEGKSKQCIEYPFELKDLEKCIDKDIKAESKILLKSKFNDFWQDMKKKPNEQSHFKNIPWAEYHKDIDNHLSKELSDDQTKNILKQNNILRILDPLPDFDNIKDEKIVKHFARLCKHLQITMAADGKKYKDLEEHIMGEFEAKQSYDYLVNKKLLYFKVSYLMPVYIELPNQIKPTIQIHIRALCRILCGKPKFKKFSIDESSELKHIPENDPKILFFKRFTTRIKNHQKLILDQNKKDKFNKY